MYEETESSGSESDEGSCSRSKCVNLSRSLTSLMLLKKGLDAKVERLPKLEKEVETLKSQNAWMEQKIQELSDGVQCTESAKKNAETELFILKDQVENWRTKAEKYEKLAEEGAQHLRGANEWREKYDTICQHAEKLLAAREEMQAKFCEATKMASSAQKRLEEVKKQNVSLKSTTEELKVRVQGFEKYSVMAIKTIDEMASLLQSTPKSEGLKRYLEFFRKDQVRLAFGVTEGPSTSFTSSFFSKAQADDSKTQNSMLGLTLSDEEEDDDTSVPSEAVDVPEVKIQKAPPIPTSKVAQLKEQVSRRRTPRLKQEPTTSTSSPAVRKIVDRIPQKPAEQSSKYSFAALNDRANARKNQLINRDNNAVIDADQPSSSSAKEPATQSKSVTIHGRKGPTVREQQQAMMKMGVKERAARMRAKLAEQQHVTDEEKPKLPTTKQMSVSEKVAMMEGGVEAMDTNTETVVADDTLGLTLSPSPAKRKPLSLSESSDDSEMTTSKRPKPDVLLFKTPPIPTSSIQPSSPAMSTRSRRSERLSESSATTSTTNTAVARNRRQKKEPTPEIAPEPKIQGPSAMQQRLLRNMNSRLAAKPKPPAKAAKGAKNQKKNAAKPVEPKVPARKEVVLSSSDESDTDLTIGEVSSKTKDQENDEVTMAASEEVVERPSSSEEVVGTKKVEKELSKAKEVEEANPNGVVEEVSAGEDAPPEEAVETASEADIVETVDEPEFQPEESVDTISDVIETTAGEEALLEEAVEKASGNEVVGTVAKDEAQPEDAVDTTSGENAVENVSQADVVETVTEDATQPEDVESATEGMETAAGDEAPFEEAVEKAVPEKVADETSEAVVQETPTNTVKKTAKEDVVKSSCKDSPESQLVAESGRIAAGEEVTTKVAEKKVAPVKRQSSSKKVQSVTAQKEETEKSVVPERGTSTATSSKTDGDEEVTSKKVLVPKRRTSTRLSALASPPMKKLKVDETSQLGEKQEENDSASKTSLPAEKKVEVSKASASEAPKKPERVIGKSVLEPAKNVDKESIKKIAEAMRQQPKEKKEVFTKKKNVAVANKSDELQFRRNSGRTAVAAPKRVETTVLKTKPDVTVPMTKKVDEPETRHETVEEVVKEQETDPIVSDEDEDEPAMRIAVDDDDDEPTQTKVQKSAPSNEKEDVDEPMEVCEPVPSTQTQKLDPKPSPSPVKREPSKKNSKKSGASVTDLGLDLSSDSDSEKEEMAPTTKPSVPESSSINIPKLNKAGKVPLVKIIDDVSLINMPKKGKKLPIEPKRPVPASQAAKKFKNAKKIDEASAQLLQAFSMKQSTEQVLKVMSTANLEKIQRMKADDVANTMLEHLKHSTKSEMWGVVLLQQKHGKLEQVKNQEEENHLHCAYELTECADELWPAFIKRMTLELAIQNNLTSAQCGCYVRLLTHAVAFANTLSHEEKSAWCQRAMKLIFVKHTEHATTSLIYALLGNSWPSFEWIVSEIESRTEWATILRIVARRDTQQFSVISWVLRARFDYTMLTEVTSQETNNLLGAISTRIFAAPMVHWKDDGKFEVSTSSQMEILSLVKLAVSKAPEPLQYAFSELKKHMRILDEILLEKDDSKDQPLFCVRNSSRKQHLNDEGLAALAVRSGLIISIFSVYLKANDPSVNGAILHAMRAVSSQLHTQTETLQELTKTKGVLQPDERMRVEAIVTDMTSFVEKFTMYHINAANEPEKPEQTGASTSST